MGTPVVLDGSPGLRRRPMNRIVQPLQQMGVNIQSNQGCAPLHLLSSPYPLKPLEYTLPVASAQVKSCLLLAALAASAPTTLHEPTLSRDHTERMLRSMGVQVITGADKEHPQSDHAIFSVTLDPPSPLVLSPLHLTLPGDISAAAFLIVAALITPGADIVLRGVGLNPTRTGLLDALAGMGADIRIQNFISGEADQNPGGEPVGDLHVRYSSLRGTHVDGELVTRMIDEFPVFAVAAACAQGDTVVAQADELRHKESDRITALCQELRLLNVEVDETPDGFIIHGDANRLKGNPSPLQTHGDHRLAMSLIVAGLAAKGSVTIADPEIISESFPAFVETLRSLGAKLS
jgi:3-phosphoshikimate 1-carboxyvinyltransferase